jgi:SAM-dependent methyltransferase
MIVGATSCRACGASLDVTLVDLGNSPLCESFLNADQVEAPEVFYPLRVRLCTSCWLGQLPAFVPAEEIFTEYAYFSSYSDSWVQHARTYTELMTERLALDAASLVVELASNDGYLLQHFVEAGIPVLGIDPAANVAPAAEARGVPTIVEFFGVALAERLAGEGRLADLVIGNNVLAQAPDLHDFLGGVAILLAPGGTATFEFPHLARLVERLQYDTIYHEHFSYFSLASIEVLLGRNGLALVDVEELPSHGGSLRVHAAHAAAGRPVSKSVERIAAYEREHGFRAPDRFRRFSGDVMESKRALLELLIKARREGKKVAGYGAPGKGNTLLNYCGIRSDLIEYTVDRNEYKHGRYTPGTHIPIHPPEVLAEWRPDLIVILPWNLSQEISTQLAYTAEWGAQLAVPVPVATVFEPGSVPEVDTPPALSFS